MGKGGKAKGKGKGFPTHTGSGNPPTATTSKTQTSTFVEKRMCHWCGLRGHLVKDCKAKRAGKPRAIKNGQLVRAVEDGDGDYEDSLLGSISFGAYSLQW